MRNMKRHISALLIVLAGVALCLSPSACAQAQSGSGSTSLTLQGNDFARCKPVPEVSGGSGLYDRYEQHTCRRDDQRVWVIQASSRRERVKLHQIAAHATAPGWPITVCNASGGYSVDAARFVDEGVVWPTNAKEREEYRKERRAYVRWVTGYAEANDCTLHTYQAHV